MRPLVAALATAALFTSIAAGAQDKAPAPAPAPQGKEAYQPGLGEIMALQQMRHIKLWFAGHDGNWPLADYEIGELKEGFDNVTELLGGDIVEQHVGGPLADLQNAIDGKSSAAFTAAFDGLSAGCNACHHTLDHPFIVIQRPMVLPYSNQVFTPQR